MCLINCNIGVEEKKEEKRNTDLTYENRIKIEEMLRSRTKYTIQQIADEIGRNKSIVFLFLGTPVFRDTYQKQLDIIIKRI